MQQPPRGTAPGGLVPTVVALIILNASLAFENVWPTPAIRWRGELSIECALILLGVAFFSGRRMLSRASLRRVAWLWLLLVIGRYASVTAPALYGRPINLYWDSRHLSAVAGMLGRVASWRLIAAALAAVVLVPLALVAVFRWCVTRVARTTSASPRARSFVMAGAAVVMAGWFLAQVAGGAASAWFPAPASATYVQQAALLATEITGVGARGPGPSPAMRSDLANVAGADVLLIFMESYGAVTYDRPAYASVLAQGRQQFLQDIRASGRDVVSGFVESPTFGGNSWLAHISLLSGVEVRDQSTSERLMSQTRDTMASVFSRRGYRTVAVMPGLQLGWPEGGFYHFDRIYDMQGLEYGGPPFGWWIIPDQFTYARMDAREIAPAARPPVFVFLPTTSTHTPFMPRAPYQPDWTRMLTPTPFEPADVEASWSEEFDWMNLAPHYVRAVGYAFKALGGYLRYRSDRDLVIVLLGDHQPPALVSGSGASWEVPVHVITSRPAVLEALKTRGFTPGIQPTHPPIGRMHQLLPVLLDAFGSPAH